jgi:hypothetical protein
VTRLDAMRALLALPIADDHQRVSRAIKGYEAADREALRIAAVTIKTKRKPRKQNAAKASRLAFVQAVHLGKGA